VAIDRPSGAPPARSARVLLVAPQPFFELRGTPLNVLQMVRTLCAAGYEVHLVTYEVGAAVDVPGLVHHRALRVPGIHSVPIGFSGRKVVLDVALALRVWSLLLTRRFDVVHAVEEAVFFTMPAAKLRGLPVIYDLDSSIPHQLEYSGAVHNRAVLRVVRALERAAIRRADLAITVCQALSDVVRDVDARVPVAQIEDSPMEETLRDPAPGEVAAVRREFGLDGAPLAVYTGNLAPYQGVDLLLAAVPILVGRCPAARVLVVGGEPPQIEAARAALRAQHLDHAVVFAGQQPPERMAGFMAAGDALVSPRRSGLNTPLKLYSYMRAGVPIVATALPTHTQVLDDSTAVLCEPTPDGLGEALARVLADPAAYALRGAAARARVSQRYSREAFARKLVSAYASLLNGKAPRR
jgi:glycosyltransferase involved in cell wall biosynthesis